MNTCISILCVPLYIIGFVGGLIIRPLFVGFVGGYTYLELKTHKEIAIDQAVQLNEV